MKKIIILGIDPGLANCGYCIFEQSFENKKSSVLESGTIKTEKTKKKQEIYASSDNLARIDILLKKLEDVITIYKPEVLAIERFSNLRDASSSAKYSLAYGAIYTLCKSFKLVLIEISSQEAKVNASGKKTASKEEVIEYIRSKYKNGWDSKKDKEHEADAINIAECSLNSSMLKTLFDFGRVYEKK